MSALAQSDTSAVVKRFHTAERLLAFESGRIEIVTLGGQSIGKASYAPGWRWSECVSGSSPPVHGGPEPVGLVLSGRARVRSQEGSELDLLAGDVFRTSITGEYDMWVAGPRPCEILYVSGVETLIRALRGGA
ncbi:MAG TPA: hypothetical protein VMF70_11290 [Gemmatimonadales bacterium]|nr:hypothetical protein [Gemmatimonadales bacterium]